MKYLIVVAAFVMFLACEKQANVDKIPKQAVAGEASGTIEKHLFELNITLQNLQKGSEEPYIWGGSSSSSQDSPLDLNQDSIFDIRYGCHVYLLYDILVYKSFYFSNNYDDSFEFAVLEGDFVKFNSQQLNVLQLFDEYNVIDSTLKWLSSSDNDVFALSYYYDYNNYVHEELDEWGYSNQSFFCNQNIENKYIGIRKKMKTNYVYGWVKVAIQDYSVLEIKESYFTSSF